MTREEYKKLFETDENGCFLNLIIPAEGDLPELNLIGKMPATFTLDEVIRMKKYSSSLFEQIKD